MPRIQKVTEKVFAEIAETPQKKGAYTTFLNIDKVLNLPEDNLLLDMKEQYSDIVYSRRKELKTLAALEEIIIQLRCKHVISKEIRLSLSRNYIYARSIFYRRGNQIHDIRIVVGSTMEWGTDLVGLLERVPTAPDEVDMFVNEEFTDMCMEKLSVAMDKEIKKNTNQLKVLTRG